VRGDVLHEQRVAVGRRLGDEVGRDRGAGAGAVVDQDLLSHGGVELGADRARQHVGNAARRETQHQPDRLARIIGLGERAAGRKRGRAHDQS
jgi:hypothetical protein